MYGRLTQICNDHECSCKHSDAEAAKTQNLLALVIAAVLIFGVLGINWG